MTADELRPLVAAALENARAGVHAHWSPYGQHEASGRVAALEAVLGALDGDASRLQVLGVTSSERI